MDSCSVLHKMWDRLHGIESSLVSSLARMQALQMPLTMDAQELECRSQDNVSVGPGSASGRKQTSKNKC